ncbi:purine permease 3-like, partial [Asparagus officinalis]|uniref:purine permease 3-like n=1 Tax=Asparagus officinalis TaxID=4686 RepID=UPI00098E6E5E
STSSILISTQLSFTALFSFLVVRQRFTAYSINAVILLTVGPIVLGLSSSKDRPEGESNRKYYLGFFMTITASVLIGVILPLTERTYKMVNEGMSYVVVMEVQFVIGVFGSVFCLVGMLVSKDFEAIRREAKEFGLGEEKYYVVLIFGAIFWQFTNLGLVGVISCSSSLFGGILIAVLLPLLEILSVIFFHENFDGSKGVALALCLWGFVSYLYGERKQQKKLKKKREVELP